MERKEKEKSFLKDFLELLLAFPQFYLSLDLDFKKLVGQAPMAYARLSTKKQFQTMAKKRDLKQTINYVCSDLFAEGVAASLYGTANNEEAVNNLLSSIIVTRNDFVKRVSHPEPGMTAREYYRQLISDFNQRINEIIDQIGTLA